MPKDKTPKIICLKKYVVEFGENIFSTDGNILFCKLCEVKVGAEKRFIVTQHIKTGKHTSALQRLEKQKQIKSQQLVTSCAKKSTFHQELCEALLCANIPLNKLSNTKFKEFLTKYTGKEIPVESTLRKSYVDDVYMKTLNDIRAYVDGKKIWVSIDETTDVCGRYIANVIIGTLEQNKPGKIFLLNTEELEKTNHTSICRLFNNSMSILWPNGIKHNDVLLFLSDAAPYMVKAGHSIQSFFSKIIHITCLAHGLHRIAETVRAEFPEVDKIVSNVKKVFRKAPSRIQIFKNKAPTLALPPEPILTRWGTWIKACLYYCQNFEVIETIIDSLDENEAVSIKDTKKYLKEPRIKSQLACIKSNFSFLPDAITQLEKQKVTLCEAISIVEDARKNLTSIQGAIGKIIKTKIENVIEKNNGYKMAVQISKILLGEEENTDGLPEDMNVNDLVYFKYAPINSADVERSFSTYKNILTSSRQSFKMENIKKCLIIQCNNEEIEINQDNGRNN